MKTDKEKRVYQFPNLAQSKDELNLADYALVVLDGEVPRGCDEIVRRPMVWDERQRRYVEREITIRVTPSLGFPTWEDAEIVLSLMYLALQQSRLRELTVHFSRYQIIQTLNWHNTGAKYDRIAEGLDRWCGISVKAPNAWWLADEKHTAGPGGFHVIDDYALSDHDKYNRKRKAPETHTSYARWNSVMLKNFVHGNVKDFDLKFMTSLRYNTTKALYRFLDKRFYKRTYQEFFVEELAFERLGMKREGYLRKGSLDIYAVKQQLDKGYNELVTRGYLAAVVTADRYWKDGTEWKVKFLLEGKPIRGGDSDSQLTRVDRPERTERPKSEAGDGLRAELVERGFDRALAERFVRSLDAQFIRERIAYADWKYRHRLGRSAFSILADNLHNPEKYHLEQDFLKWYSSKSENAAHELKRKQAAKREVETVTKENNAVKSYLDSLPMNLRESTINEAWDKAGPGDLTYRDKSTPSAKAVENRVLREHVLPLLAGKDRATAA